MDDIIKLFFKNLETLKKPCDPLNVKIPLILACLTKYCANLLGNLATPSLINP